jgi:hypothetical protein
VRRLLADIFGDARRRMERETQQWAERMADEMTSYDTMADFTHAAVANVPADVDVNKVAGYVTGSSGVEWTAADRAKYASKVVITIDQTPDGSDFASGKAEVYDVEAEAGTIANAVTGVQERQRIGKSYSTIYIQQGSLAELKAALTDAKVTMTRVGFGLAWWALSQAQAIAQLGNEIVFIQWASPTTNPNTALPGTNLTLGEANVDLSVTQTSWYAPPAPAPSWQSQALSLAETHATGLDDLVTLLKAHQ